MTFPTKRAALYFCAHLEAHSDAHFVCLDNNHHKALSQIPPNAKVSYEHQLQRLDSSLKKLAWGLVLFSCLLGCLAVPSAFTSVSSQHANIFWLLAMVLGTHFLSLFIWFIMSLKKASQSAHDFGLILTLLKWFSLKLAHTLQINEQTQQALIAYRLHPHSRHWLVGALSHTAWAGYLFAAWLTTLLVLLTKQVNFVWETSLLNESFFLSLTHYLAWLPAWFGIAMPTSHDVQLSQLSLVIQEQSTRQHWANFLLSSLFLYGVLPRVILAGYCSIKLILANKSLPYSAQETALLHSSQAAESQQSIILDPDRASSANQEQVTPPLTKADTSSASRWALFEWGHPIPMALQHLPPLMRVNDRETQAAFFHLEGDKTIHVLVDSRQSPDRGAERFLNKARQCHPNLRLALSRNEPDFVEDWLQLAQRLNITCSELNVGA